ncbi:amidohydrolase family protein [Paenibacillus senegalensis]|uniref:amidohydrolase family protein n=1 Tax=Paenibacillus senegalensis TaxID=1465766 RepID=UPI00028A131E|nr:amidohydrolase family protein [Paenibacillus senegalensis]
MIIDFHTHYTLGEVFVKKQYDADKVISEMEANSIVSQLLLPLDGLVFDYKEDNNRIMELVQTYPQRFVGMGTVHPRRPKEAVEEMDRCLQSAGMIGMKFHPWLQAFSPLEDYFQSLAEEANLRKTLFFFHDGTPPYTEPFQIAEVARANPDLTVVMGHSGLNDLWRESLLAARKYDNIWLCLCSCPYSGMLEIAQTLGGERTIWGSDYPLATARDTRDRIRQVEMLTVSDRVKEDILYHNALKLITRFHPAFHSAKGKGPS